MGETGQNESQQIKTLRTSRKLTRKKRFNSINKFIDLIQGKITMNEQEAGSKQIEDKEARRKKYRRNKTKTHMLDRNQHIKDLIVFNNMHVLIKQKQKEKIERLFEKKREGAEEEKNQVEIIDDKLSAGS